MLGCAVYMYKCIRTRSFITPQPAPLVHLVVQRSDSLVKRCTVHYLNCCVTPSSWMDLTIIGGGQFECLNAETKRNCVLRGRAGAFKIILQDNLSKLSPSHASQINFDNFFFFDSRASVIYFDPGE